MLSIEMLMLDLKNLELIVSFLETNWPIKEKQEENLKAV